jgi:cobyrinic acid a,c-diamide synthase
MASLAGRGLCVAPFKVGPDFIDPGHHTRITGVTSRNLDGWMLSQEYNLELFEKHSARVDIAVVEGVMGLFDGYDGKSEAGSTAQMAKWLGIPVVLVVNAKSMARTAAALVQGVERFDKNVKFAGVIFNQVGSKRHLVYLKEALENHVEMPCLGGIPRAPEITIPERHLGLVTQDEYVLSDENVDKLAGLIEENIDIDRLLNRLPDIDGCTSNPKIACLEKKSRVRIGVARDNAFCFYYQDNLDMLEARGAELVFFSPVKEDNLPPNLDGIYFGGGYPELFAKQLAANLSLRDQIRKKSIAGMPIYGECGGFMYLCREIRAKDGNRYPMTGCFPFTTGMFPRLKSLGYRQIRLTENTLIGKCGRIVRGHEFHYSEITNCSKDIPTVYDVSARAGRNETREGYYSARTLGSYIHLHFGSQPDVAGNFVAACLDYKRERVKNS